MKLEAIEPPHRTFPLLGPSLHRLVHVHPLDMAGHQRRGVNDGDARTLTQSARMEEQQQVEADLGLTFHETVVGHCIGEIRPEMLPDEEQVVVLEVAERAELERYQDGHDLAV